MSNGAEREARKHERWDEIRAAVDRLAEAVEALERDRVIRSQASGLSTYNALREALAEYYWYEDQRCEEEK